MVQVTHVGWRRQAATGADLQYGREEEEERERSQTDACWDGVTCLLAEYLKLKLHYSSN